MLTREEKETILTFNEEVNGLADVETFNGRMIRDIRKAAEMYPNDVQITDNGDGSIRATFPKKWVKIRAPRILTDEQRAEMAEKARKNLFKS